MCRRCNSKGYTSCYHITPHITLKAIRQSAEYEPVPDSDIYTSTPQAGFHATRQQLLAGKFGIWAEALGLSGVGGQASAGGERSNKETFSCDSIVTTYFDPTDEWVVNCLAAKTVATNLVFGCETAQSANAETKVGISVPQTPVAVGLDGNVNVEKNQTLGFQSTDIVVGFRVKKYRYKKKSLFSKERKLEGKLSISGAEMLDDKAGPAKGVFSQKEGEEQKGSIEECCVKKTLSSSSLA
ncbi:hypothetical protein GGI43DRAFT_426225 [Trichoderma evansii]